MALLEFRVGSGFLKRRWGIWISDAPRGLCMLDVGRRLEMVVMGGLHLGDSSMYMYSPFFCPLFWDGIIAFLLSGKRIVGYDRGTTNGFSVANFPRTPPRSPTHHDSAHCDEWIPLTFDPDRSLQSTSNYGCTSKLSVTHTGPCLAERLMEGLRRLGAFATNCGSETVSAPDR